MIAPYNFWMMTALAPPPPLQIAAHPNSPSFNWCNNVTKILDPEELWSDTF